MQVIQECSRVTKLEQGLVKLDNSFAQLTASSVATEMAVVSAYKVSALIRDVRALIMS